MPLSCTVMAMPTSSGAGGRRAAREPATVTSTPPVSVNLMALPTRLVMI